MLTLAGCPPKANDPAPEPNGNKTGKKTLVSPPSEAGQTAMRFVSDPTLQEMRVVYENGKDGGALSIVETLGGGVGILDYDADGRDDLFLPIGGTIDADRTLGPLPSRLLRNATPLDDASPSALDWQDVSESSGAAATPMYSHGAACCDYDNDGFRDVLLTGYRRLQLLRNMGDGSFVDVTDQAGLLADDTHSTTAAWGDLNRDGWADLYVTHYTDWGPGNDPACGNGRNPEVCSPKRFGPLDDAIYLSDGDGTFSPAAGLDLSGGKGLAVMLADVDGDAMLDAIVANDTTENHLYMNQTAPGEASLSLREDAIGRGMAFDDQAGMTGSMGIALSDYNGDQRPDFFVSNYEQELFALYRNEGDGDFTHVSKRVGLQLLGRLMVTFGCVACDFDADGDEDVALVNGHVMYNPINTPMAQLPLLLEMRRRTVNGRETRTLSRTQPGGYFSQPHVGRGLADADLDRDGRRDLAVSHTLEPAEALLNRTPTEGRTLGLVLVGTADSREPIGTVVLARLASGRVLYRQLVGGVSYLSTPARDLPLAWPADDPPESIEIRWPTGEPTTIAADAIGDRDRLVVVQGD